MPLEVLHGALVLLRGLERGEGSEITPLAGLRIDLAGIEPIFSRAKLADHDCRSVTYKADAGPVVVCERPLF